MIYFMQDSGTFHIKIGFVEGNNLTSAEMRMKALQTGNPSVLVLLATMPGGRSEEARQHHKHAEDRICGEWFRPTPEIIKTILFWARLEVGQIRMQAQRDRRIKEARARTLLASLEADGFRLELCENNVVRVQHPTNVLSDLAMDQVEDLCPQLGRILIGRAVIEARRKALADCAPPMGA